MSFQHAKVIKQETENRSLKALRRDVHEGIEYASAEGKFTTRFNKEDLHCKQADIDIVYKELLALSYKVTDNKDTLIVSWEDPK